MTNREFFLARREAEFPTTLKVLEALPEEQLGYRPHPGSRSARELATHIVYGDTICAELITKAGVDYKEPPPAESRAAVLSAAKVADDKLRAALGTLTENGWQKKVKLKAGKKEFGVVLGEFLWFIHFGVIHHRAQMSTYLRPMGGKVPPIYGPSGDDRTGGL